MFATILNRISFTVVIGSMIYAMMFFGALYTMVFIIRSVKNDMEEK